MNAFNWKSQPSELAPALRAKVNRNSPGPASQITFSRSVPHSINTEIVRDGDKVQRLRKAAI